MFSAAAYFFTDSWSSKETCLKGMHIKIFIFHTFETMIWMNVKDLTLRCYEDQTTQWTFLGKKKRKEKEETCLSRVEEIKKCLTACQHVDHPPEARGVHAVCVLTRPPDAGSLFSASAAVVVQKGGEVAFGSCSCSSYHRRTCFSAPVQLQCNPFSICLSTVSMSLSTYQLVMLRSHIRQCVPIFNCPHYH